MNGKMDAERRTAGLFLTSVFPSIEVTFDKSPRLNVVHGVVQGMIIREQIRIVLKHVRNNIRHRGRIAYRTTASPRCPYASRPDFPEPHRPSRNALTTITRNVCGKAPDFRSIR